ncbi:hypothetical protein L9F63_007034, partial [Diploptera punctata]
TRNFSSHALMVFLSGSFPPYSLRKQFLFAILFYATIVQQLRLIEMWENFLFYIFIQA